MGSSDRRTLTAEQEAYILEHINDRPRTAVARAAGVSVSSLYRIVRLHGGEMLYGRTRRNPAHVEAVQRYYPEMTGREIELSFGVPCRRADKIARELGVRHTPETLERIRRENAARLAVNSRKVDQSAKSRKWKATRRLDQWRVWEGKPQMTGFRFSEIPVRTYKARYYLVMRYGYLLSEDPCTLLYDGHTLRRPHGMRPHIGTEEYYTRKYRLTFAPAD